MCIVLALLLLPTSAAVLMFVLRRISVSVGVSFIGQRWVLGRLSLLSVSSYLCSKLNFFYRFSLLPICDILSPKKQLCFQPMTIGDLVIQDFGMANSQCCERQAITDAVPLLLNNKLLALFQI